MSECISEKRILPAVWKISREERAVWKQSVQVWMILGVEIHSRSFGERLSTYKDSSMAL